jgi:hypothetical protein
MAGYINVSLVDLLEYVIDSESDSSSDDVGL